MGENNHQQDKFPPEDRSHHAEIVLNYAFAPSAGGNLSPLPLTISRKLFEGPAASLRSIIVEALGIEGITVKLGDVRFWRTKTPLESRIASNSIKSWIQHLLPIGEQVPVVIPFTESISVAVGEWISNERLVHLVVTGGDTPFSVESALYNSESSPGPPLAATPTIVFGKYNLGYYPGRKDWKEVKEGERHSKDIELALNWSSAGCGAESSVAPVDLVPAVLLGISRFSTGAPNHEVQVMTHVSDFHSNGFTVHFDAFGRTLVYNGWLSWMAISLRHSCQPPGGETLQWGTVDSQSSHPRKVGRRYATQRVRFRHAYQQAPQVFSCLAGFTIGGSGSSRWDIKTFVTGISREGFTLHVEKTRDSERDVNEVLAHALVSWVAFPEGKTSGREMTCGEFYLSEGVRTQKNNGKDVEWRGKTTFTEEFTSPPQVFVAFKGFDTNKSDDARFGVSVEKTTTKGIEWKIETWAGNVASSASVGFFAVGDL